MPPKKQLRGKVAGHGTNITNAKARGVSGGALSQNRYMAFCASCRASAAWRRNGYNNLSVPDQGRLLGTLYRGSLSGADRALCAVPTPKALLTVTFNIKKKGSSLVGVFWKHRELTFRVYGKLISIDWAENDVCKGKVVLSLEKGLAFVAKLKKNVKTYWQLPSKYKGIERTAQFTITEAQSEGTIVAQLNAIENRIVNAQQRQYMSEDALMIEALYANGV